MPKLNLMSRKLALWIGFLGIIIPLIVMLVFPYRWLVSLEEASGIARKATLDNYLESVTNEIHYAYERNAQRGLNLPASLFTGKRGAEKLAQHLWKQMPWVARWLFLVFIAEDEEVEVMFFDPRCEPEESHSETASGTAGCWGSPSLTPEVQAVNAASSSWMLLGLQHAIVENVDLQVDEKNTEVRMILNPITNEARHVVGIAGMILDPEYFRTKEVPVAIEQFLPKYLGEDEYSHLLVKLHDDCGQVVYSTTCHGPQESIELAGAPAARKAFTFVFEDWAIELGSEHLSPEAWARSNFMINLSMSALLGLVLLGGTVFTLRTAAREIRLSQMKSDFVSNVSHELRTPLASSRTFGEFLRLRRVPDLEKAAEYGEYIETESRRLTQLINNILDFSKIESGQKTYVFKETELKTLLESALHL